MMFRIISKHHSALERQVAESVRIEEVSNQPGNCLNIKNEWAGSKLPGIMVSKPKGTSGKGRQKTEKANSKRSRILAGENKEMDQNRDQETDKDQPPPGKRTRTTIEHQKNVETEKIVTQVSQKYKYSS